MPNGPRIGADCQYKTENSYIKCNSCDSNNLDKNSIFSTSNSELKFCFILALESDGFGPHPLFHCLVAEKKGRLIGYAIFYFTYSTWCGKAMYLEDLYVIPEVRKHGVGSLLFDAVVKVRVPEFIPTIYLNKSVISFKL